MSKIRRELEALREENQRLKQVDLEGCNQKVKEENSNLRIELHSQALTISNLRKQVEELGDCVAEGLVRETSLELRIEELGEANEDLASIISDQADDEVEADPESGD